MASHIPLALSLLGSFAGYPLSSGTQKTASNPPPTVAPPAPPQAPWNASAVVPSPPIHSSGPIPSTNPNAPHNTSSTPGSTPPTTNPAASTLCDVSAYNSHRRSMMFINSNSSLPRFVKYVPNTLMEPRLIRFVAKHARTRELALIMGAARTLLLAQTLLLGIVMFVENFVHDDNN